MLVTEVRNKYVAGAFRGGDDGNEYELLCMHGLKISDVQFLTKPLIDGTRKIFVTFPPKRVLTLNWREQENYLEANATVRKPRVR